MKYFFSFLFTVLFTILCSSQKPIKQNPSQLYESVKKLNFLGSVLYVAAHPDDENTRLISYFSNHVKARTGYLSMTRGDGGQNLVAGNQYIQLRAVKTGVFRRVAAADNDLPARPAKIQHIAIGLAKNDPAGTATYEANLVAFLDEMDRRLFGRELLRLLGSESLNSMAEKGTLMPFLEKQRFQDKPLIDSLGGWMGEMLPLRGMTWNSTPHQF